MSGVRRANRNSRIADFLPGVVNQVLTAMHAAAGIGMQPHRFKMKIEFENGDTNIARPVLLHHSRDSYKLAT
jgi:hypothetical protein